MDFLEDSINALKYIDILEDNCGQWLLAISYLSRPIFQDDNAPIHRAQKVMEYRVKNKIKMLSWPAQSPDLNIIENIWQRLKRELQKLAK